MRSTRYLGTIPPATRSRGSRKPPASRFHWTERSWTWAMDIAAKDPTQRRRRARAGGVTPECTAAEPEQREASECRGFYRVSLDQDLQGRLFHLEKCESFHDQTMTSESFELVMVCPLMLRWSSQR